MFGFLKRAAKKLTDLVTKTVKYAWEHKGEIINTIKSILDIKERYDEVFE